MSNRFLVGMVTFGRHTLNCKKSKEMKGFTIYELIVVGIIMLVMLSVIVINLSGTYRRIGLENSVNKMISFLRYGQSYAMTRWKLVTAEVLPEENKIELKVDVKLDDGSTEERLLKIFKLPNNFRMETEIYKIKFDSSTGFDIISVDPDSPALYRSSIFVVDAGGREKEVELWGFGGYIRLKSK